MPHNTIGEIDLPFWGYLPQKLSIDPQLGEPHLNGVTSPKTWTEVHSVSNVLYRAPKCLLWASYWPLGWICHLLMLRLPPGESCLAASRAEHCWGTHLCISTTIGHNKMVQFQTHQLLVYFWPKTCVFLSVFLFCTIPTWPKSTFVQRNSISWIPPKVAL